MNTAKPFLPRRLSGLNSSFLIGETPYAGGYGVYTARVMLDYDPNTKQMTSPDILDQNPHFTQSYNRYAYVMNNPMKFTDPSGYVSNEHYSMRPQGASILGHDYHGQTEQMAYIDFEKEMYKMDLFWGFMEYRTLAGYGSSPSLSLGSSTGNDGGGNSTSGNDGGGIALTYGSMLMGASGYTIGQKMSAKARFKPLYYNNGTLYRPASMGYKFGPLSGEFATKLGFGLRTGGSILGGFGIAYTIYQTGNGKISLVQGGFDIGFGIVGFLGPFGLGISSVYFIGNTFIPGGWQATPQHMYDQIQRNSFDGIWISPYNHFK